MLIRRIGLARGLCAAIRATEKVLRGASLTRYEDSSRIGRGGQEQKISTSQKPITRANKISNNDMFTCGFNTLPYSPAAGTHDLVVADLRLQSIQQGFLDLIMEAIGFIIGQGPLYGSIAERIGKASFSITNSFAHKYIKQLHGFQFFWGDLFHNVQNVIMRHRRIDQEGHIARHGGKNGDWLELDRLAVVAEQGLPPLWLMSQAKLFRFLLASLVTSV